MDHTRTILSVDFGVTGLPEKYRRIQVLAVEGTAVDKEKVPEDGSNVGLIVGLIVVAVVVVVVIIGLVVWRCVRRESKPQHWLDEFRLKINDVKKKVEGTPTLIAERVSLLERIQTKYYETAPHEDNSTRYVPGEEEVERPLQQSTTTQQDYESAVDEILGGRITLVSSSLDETDGVTENMSVLVGEVSRYLDVTTGCVQLHAALMVFKKILEVEAHLATNLPVQWDFENGENNMKILTRFGDELENTKQNLNSDGGRIVFEVDEEYKECKKKIENRRDEIQSERKKYAAFESVMKNRELPKLFNGNKLPSKPDLDEELENLEIYDEIYEILGNDVPEAWKTICSLALAYQSITKSSEADVCYQVDFRLLRVFGDKNRVASVQPTGPPPELLEMCSRMTSFLLQRTQEKDKAGVLSFVVRFWSVLDLQELNAHFPKWEAAKAFSGHDYLTSEEKLRRVLADRLKGQPGESDTTRTWISRSMLGFWTEDPMFVRALTKAVLDSITDSRHELMNGGCRLIDDYCERLLCRFTSRESNSCGLNLKIEMLFAVQEWIETQNVREGVFKDILICLRSKNVIGNDDILAWVSDPRNEAPQRYINIVGDVIGNQEKERLEDLHPGDVDENLLQNIQVACSEISKKIATKATRIKEWMQQDVSLQDNRGKNGFVKLIVGVTCEQVFRKDATVDGVCDILLHYVKTTEQKLEALDSLKEINMAFSEHSDKLTELYMRLFEKGILTTESVVRWRNRARDETAPTSIEYLDKLLRAQWMPLLTLLEEIKEPHDIANFIVSMHRLVPASQRLDFGQKAIMRMVRASREDQGPGEKFDLLKFHKMIPILWFIARHDPHIERKIVNAMKCGVSGENNANMCGSPWYLPLIKTLLFGNALSMSVVRDCHNSRHTDEVGYNQTSYDQIAGFTKELCFDN